MEKKIYYTPITFKSVLSNDNWNYGGNAFSVISVNITGKPFKMDVNQYGKTKKEAEERLMNFISGKGTNNIECVEKFED